MAAVIILGIGTAVLFFLLGLSYGIRIGEGR